MSADQARAEYSVVGEGDRDAAAGLAQEISVEDLPKDFVTRLTELYGAPCKSRLLRGQHGVTAFDFTEPDGPEARAGCIPTSPSRTRHVAVLAHGLGTRKDLTYDGVFHARLLEAGYSILAYTFYGHGWSYAGHEVAPPGACCGCAQVLYDKDLFIAQLKELLGHVLGPTEPVDLWIGHSTGCVVGALAAAEGAWPIRRMALISPAMWASKPALARVVDRLHPVSTALITNSDLLLKVVGDEYLKNNDNAFGHQNGTYFFPEVHEEAAEFIKRKFRLHPQIAKAVLAINMTFLRGDLLPQHRASWQALLQKEGAPQTLLVWGDHDIVVPFEHAQEVVAWNPNRVTLTPLKDMGHESPAEAPERVVGAILECFGKPGA